MTHVEQEIASQPGFWRRAADMAGDVGGALPREGERVAVVGCGTSWFMAQSYAGLREASGHGETDAFAASEFPLGRRYDRVVSICRSGTTTEVCDLFGRLSGDVPTTAIVGDPDTPLPGLVDDTVVLDFADEKSVLMTRFATTALTLLRVHLGQDVTRAIADAEEAVTAPSPVDVSAVEQISYLGRGWTIGLAHEAALKAREAATFWTESYPAMDYRHGPISVTGPKRVAWMFGEAPAGLAEDVAKTGGTFVASGLDPLADLIRAQRVAVALAKHRGLDPDNPKSLTRSVVLA